MSWCAWITSIDLLSCLLNPINLLWQWLMPLSLTSSAPTQLFVFSSVIVGQQLRGKSFKIFVPNSVLSRHSLQPIILHQMALLNEQIWKSLRSWEDWLSHVAASINGSINTSTGKTQHYSLYGCDKRLPYDVLVHSSVHLHSFDDYSKLQLHCFQSIHESVREKLKASREEVLHKQHAHDTPVTIQVGDSVMNRAPDRSCKLFPKFICPFLVTSRGHPIKFKNLDLSNNVTEVVHVAASRRLVFL